MKNYDVIIIGAGPAGIFTALEIADTGLSVLILEKGLDIRDRIALNKNRTAPASDRRANIVSGWGGAGAFSDGKLTLTTDYGGNLDDYMNKGELSRLISYVDSIYCQFGGADRKVYGDEHLEELHALKRKAAAADLAFIPARIRHLGTDVNSEILSHMRDSLPNNVTVIAKTPVDTILADKDGSVLGVVAGGAVAAGDGHRLAEVLPDALQQHHKALVNEDGVGAVAAAELPHTERGGELLCAVRFQAVLFDRHMYHVLSRGQAPIFTFSFLSLIHI